MITRSDFNYIKENFSNIANTIYDNNCEMQNRLTTIEVDCNVIKDNLAQISINENDLYNTINKVDIISDISNVSSNRINELESCFYQITIDIEKMSKAIEELAEKIKELTSAGNSQKNRVPDLKSDLDFFYGVPSLEEIFLKGD